MFAALSAAYNNEASNILNSLLFKFLSTIFLITSLYLYRKAFKSSLVKWIIIITLIYIPFIIGIDQLIKPSNLEFT